MQGHNCVLLLYCISVPENSGIKARQPHTTEEAMVGNSTILSQSSVANWFPVKIALSHVNAPAKHNFGRPVAQWSKIISSPKLQQKKTFDDMIWYYYNKIEIKSATHFFLFNMKERNQKSAISLRCHTAI